MATPKAGRQPNLFRDLLSTKLIVIPVVPDIIPDII